MSSGDRVQIDLDIREIRGAHPGGMRMDDESPSQDVYDDPFIVLKDGSRKYVSVETAKHVLHLLASRGDDGFGDSAAG